MHGHVPSDFVAVVVFHHSVSRVFFLAFRTREMFVPRVCICKVKNIPSDFVVVIAFHHSVSRVWQMYAKHVCPSHAFHTCDIFVPRVWRTPDQGSRPTRVAEAVLCTRQPRPATAVAAGQHRGRATVVVKSLSGLPAGWTGRRG